MCWVCVMSIVSQDPVCPSSLVHVQWSTGHRSQVTGPTCLWGRSSSCTGGCGLCSRLFHRSLWPPPSPAAAVTPSWAFQQLRLHQPRRAASLRAATVLFHRVVFELGRRLALFPRRGRMFSQLFQARVRRILTNQRQ